MCGYQGVGLFRRDPPQCGSRETGRTERSAGCGIPITGSKTTGAAAKLHFKDEKVGGRLTAGPKFRADSLGGRAIIFGGIIEAVERRL